MKSIEVLLWVGLAAVLAYFAVVLSGGSQLTAEQQAARSAVDVYAPLVVFGLGAIAALGYAFYVWKYRPAAGPVRGASAPVPHKPAPSAKDFQPDPMPEGFHEDFDEKLLRLSGFGLEILDRNGGDSVVRPKTDAARDLAAEVWRMMQWFHKIYENRISDRAPAGDILLKVNGDSERFVIRDVVTLPGDGGYAVGVYAEMAHDLFAFCDLGDVSSAREETLEDGARRLTWTLKDKPGAFEIDAAGKYIDMGAPAAVARAIRDATGTEKRLAVIQEDANIRVIRLPESRLEALKEVFDDQDVYWLDAT